MPAPVRSLVAPTFQHFHLCRSAACLRLAWRHHFVGIRRTNAQNEFTLFGLAGHDDCEPVAFPENAFTRIEPQPRLARAFVRSVTLEAVLRKDRQDIAAEIDRVRTRA